MEPPLNKTLHYIYSWERDGVMVVKHYYAPSLVDADKQFKENEGFDPKMAIPAVNVQRLNN